MSTIRSCGRCARGSAGFLPEFTFGLWLAGLCALVLIMFAVAPRAYRGSAVLRVLAYPYSAIMLLNGVGHLAGSVYLHRWAPGATTAPLLLGASSWLLVAVRALRPGGRRLIASQELGSRTMSVPES